MKRDNGRLDYGIAPDGKLGLVISGTTDVEILIYSNSPFSYRTKLAISECPSCMTDAQLRDVVRREIPGIEDRLKSELLPAIDELLHWASSVVDAGGDIPEFANLVQATSLMPASQLYSELWLQDEGGAKCGAFSVFFQKLLALFDVPAFTVDMGQTGAFTHVTALVPIASDGKTKFYLFDPTFDGTYRSRRDGAYVDLESVLNGSVAAVFAARPIPRTVMYPNEEDKAFKALDETANCDVSADELYKRCKDVRYDINFVLADWSETLRQLSIPPDADLILALLHKQVLFVSDTAGNGPRQEFLAMIARITGAN